MAIQRASPLYPVNTTTVDTGVGIDIRLLDSAQAGADDTSQTATFTHTNDNVERTFDPATGGVTNTNNAGTTLFKAGWALRLVDDMTPTDDTNCDAFLNAGTLTVNMVITPSQSGGTYASGTLGPTFRASLWRYNPSTDTGTLIAAGSSTATTWDLTPVTGDIGTAKTVSISIVVTDTTFGAVGGASAEVLYLQLGFNTGTVPNPTVGTATFTAVLTVDNTNTKITFAAGQGIHQVCTFSTTNTGVGTDVFHSLNLNMSRTYTGVGTATATKLATINKSTTNTGVGTSTNRKNITLNTTSNTGVGTNTMRADIPTDKIPTGGGGTTIVKKPIYIFED